MALLDHLEKLQQFVGVANAGSIRRHAMTRGLSQPALSKTIQILETELEAALFVRGRDGVKLTPEGDRLLLFTQKLMRETAEVEEELRGNAGARRLRGRFKLGTYQSIAVYFLPKLLHHLSQRREAMHLDFLTAPSAELVRLLLAGSVDFIISVEPPEKPGLVNHVLYEDTYSLYQRTGAVEETDAPVFTLLDARDRAGKTLRASLREAGLLQRAVGCGDFESAKSMVESGVGWGLLPERVAKPSVDAGRFQRVTSVTGLERFGAHEVALSCLRHRQTDAAVRWLTEQIRLMLQAPAFRAAARGG